MAYTFGHRDISWLSFNHRVLMQAADAAVPLLERFRFAAIFSSNLDEFYRVRMPLLMAAGTRKDADGVSTEASESLLQTARSMIQEQQESFGNILLNQLIPEATAMGVKLYYNEPIPPELLEKAAPFFTTQMLPLVRWHWLKGESPVAAPLNNEQYLLVQVSHSEQKLRLALVKIAYPDGGRLVTVHTDAEGTKHVLLADDILRHFLPHLLGTNEIVYAGSLKFTNDADLEVDDDLAENNLQMLRHKVRQRDKGPVSRILYDPVVPAAHIRFITRLMGVKDRVAVAGGRYHQLRDLSDIPLPREAGKTIYPAWPTAKVEADQDDYFDRLQQEEPFFHFPYQPYEYLLRFFAEAATHRYVQAISITLYRIAVSSRLVQSLITAARNGKKVTVFVEIKARFDELNNLRWAQAMKDAGIQITYSIPKWKVHAKVALVVWKKELEVRHYGLLATGNFNESTAAYYTDHALLTTNKGITRDLQLFFAGLAQRLAPPKFPVQQFSHLLVAPFSMRQRFLELIRHEIAHAVAGQASGIYIKMNNLEDEGMIAALYEASCAGVPIRLLIRGICRLQPGVVGQSEHIVVRRTVDRYLEHGRLFRFHNGGDPQWYAGSADWMERNLEHRMEVAFPITNKATCATLDALMDCQWPPVHHDNYEYSTQLATAQYLAQLK